MLHGAYSMLQRIFLCHKYECIIGIGSQVLILLNSGNFFKITKIPNCIQSFKASDKDTLVKPIYSSVDSSRWYFIFVTKSFDTLHQQPEMIVQL